MRHLRALAEGLLEPPRREIVRREGRKVEHPPAAMPQRGVLQASDLQRRQEPADLRELAGPLDPEGRREPLANHRVARLAPQVLRVNLGRRVQAGRRVPRDHSAREVPSSHLSPHRALSTDLPQPLPLSTC